MNWFEKLMGFAEESPQQVRNNLEAAYEATICTAILNAEANVNKQLLLTLLGGGAFGNETSWIIDGIARAFGLYQNNDLNVAIISYGTSKPFVRELIEFSN